MVTASVGTAEVVGEAADPEVVTGVAELLMGSERPVLLIGGDVYWAGGEAEARALVEAVTLPTFANDMGRGLLPADHLLCFARARSVAFREADLIVVAGTPLDFRLSYGRFPHGAVVHLVDSPGAVATHADLAAVTAGDLRATFGMLVEEVGRVSGTGSARTARADWAARLRDEEHATRQADGARLTSDASPIDPVRIYGELRRRLDRDAIVVGDGGDFVSYAGRYIDSYTSGCFLGPGPYGCLGSGTGYALAAALAHPQRQTVALYGDGAIGFSLADLDSLARHHANMVGIVGNNSIWGLEKHPMQAIFGYDVVCDLAPATALRPRGARPGLPRRARHRTGRARTRARSRVQLRRSGTRQRAHRPGRRLPTHKQPGMNVGSRRTERAHRTFTCAALQRAPIGTSRACSGFVRSCRWRSGELRRRVDCRNPAG